MNTCDPSIPDGKILADLALSLNCATQDLGRKLSPMEENILRLLHEHYANDLKRRIFQNDKNNFLVCETDAKAGLIDLTEDYACTFKTEPVFAGSAKEATIKFAAASQKIFREISIRGGQPLATLLSLSTGAPVNDSIQADLQNTISGIASFSNTFGVPVAGVDTHFNDLECPGITANLMSIGLIDKETQLVSSCRGTDNPVYLVGATNAGDKQIPSSAFVARSLYEMVCDLNDEGAIVAIQSINNGGTESTAELIVVACAEMVANGTNGIELDAALFEGEQKLTELISNKLVMIVKEECGKKLENACRKWNMRCMQIGTVVDEQKLAVLNGQSHELDLPASVLSMFHGAPSEIDIDTLPADDVTLSPIEAPVPEEHRDVAKFMITCPNLLSQQWIFEQFDSTVGTNNLSTNYITDAPVIQIKGALHALAVSFCQSATDLLKYPESVNLTAAEALRKAVCSGGEPRMLTGCLNYSGDIDAKTLYTINNYIALFCKKTGISSSGLYMNRIEAKGEPVIYSLSVGVVTFLNDKHRQMTMSFKGKGDMIYMLGKSINNLNSSEYIRNFHGIKDSPPQQIDLDMEAKLLKITQKLIARKLVKSTHNVSKGGLFMALLESAMIRSFGFDVTVDGEIRKDAFLFGESPSRIIASVGLARETAFIDFMMKTGIPFMALGHVTSEEIRIDDISYGFISDYRKKYFRE